MTKPIDEFFSEPRALKESADHLKVSYRFLQDEIYAGRLRARRLSLRVIRLMPADVEAWLEKAATTV